VLEKDDLVSATRLLDELGTLVYYDRRLYCNDESKTDFIILDPQVGSVKTKKNLLWGFS